MYTKQIENFILFAVIGFVILALTTAKPAIDAQPEVIGDVHDLPSAANPSPMPREKMCKLPAVRGHCRALLPRWRYDPATKRCHEFKFGGCDGNGNNFTSEKKCMSVCGGV